MNGKSKINIASCQFPVSGDVRKNAEYVIRQMQEAKEGGADIAHFSESALSGYGGWDYHEYIDEHQALINSSMIRIMYLARKLRIWVVVGAHHFEEGLTLPFNCLWVVNNMGDIECRYDKRFLYGLPGEDDHKWYTPGEEKVTFTLNGVRCGQLICHEWRYPELYREYKYGEVDLIFQSWYECDGNEQGDLVIGTIKGYASNNHLWISAANTSKQNSSFASCIIQPDGKQIKNLIKGKSGVSVTTVDLNQSFDDPSGPWRKKASGLLGRII